jgi:hypothetical protein
MILGNECAAKIQEIMADEPYEGLQIRNKDELSRYTEGTTLAAFVMGGGEAKAPCTMVFRWAPNPRPSQRVCDMRYAKKQKYLGLPRGFGEPRTFNPLPSSLARAEYTDMTRRTFLQQNCAVDHRPPTLKPKP